MNHLHLNRVRLVVRNEGKIKSYDSCTDLRAWSHDVATQDQYLREWMKADAPACMIPCWCLTGCLSRMTRRSRRRATPHCHPDCKSRLLLESICNSCQAVKECLQQDEDLEKFFVEEELESSHWPCDRCLEALKSIKMLWKILLDKLFGLNIAKSEDFEQDCEYSVRSVARVWQNSMIREANYVKNLAPGLCRRLCKIKTRSSPACSISPRRSLRSCCVGDNGDLRTITIKPPCCQRVSKCTSIKIRRHDNGCNACIEAEREEICAYKRKIAALQAKCNGQCENINKLRKQNQLLRKEIENICKGYPWKASLCIPNENSCLRSVTCIVPEPFEGHLENYCPVSNVDSEMIITMKNGKNESFRHVSLLQVLHKTNDPILKDVHTNKSCSQKEDPIEILNKVHCTVGAIVKREMCIANERKCQPNKTKVDASFHRVHNCNSAPSCLTVSTCTPQTSVTDFVCKRDVCDIPGIRVTNI